MLNLSENNQVSTLYLISGTPKSSGQRCRLCEQTDILGEDCIEGILQTCPIIIVLPSKYYKCIHKVFNHLWMDVTESIGHTILDSSNMV